MAMPPINDDDTTRILAAGGGLRLEMSERSVETLTRFAGAAAGKGARLEIIVNQPVSVDDLLSIASAGSGAVLFVWPQGQLVQPPSIAQ